MSSAVTFLIATVLLTFFAILGYRAIIMSIKMELKFKNRERKKNGSETKITY
jgi:hypothetical protein